MGDQVVYEEDGKFYVEDAPKPPSAFGFSTILILGLFLFLLINGLRSSGSPCGRSWAAFLFLPFAAAVIWGMFSSFNVDSGDEIGKVRGFLPKIFGKVGAAGPAGGNFARAFSMGSFAIFLAFFQYIVSVIMIMMVKPEVPKSTVFRRGFVASGISLLWSIIFIVVLTLVTTFIPPLRAVIMFAERLPFIGTLMNQGAYWILATSPVAMIGALSAHGIACSAAN